VFGKVYAAGNFVEGNEKVTADNWAGGVQLHGGGGAESDQIVETDKAAKFLKDVRTDKPMPMAPVTIQSAKEAYESVLAGAGATLPHRDPVDLRIIEQVRTGKVTYEAGKGIITDVRQVGGYPEYKGEPKADLGADGVPLWWKKKYGLDASDAALASKDLKGDGYTVMEKYLDGLDPTRKIDWKEGKSNLNALSADVFKAPAM
jgi:hypothetical protein